MSVLGRYQARLSSLLLEGRTPAEIRETLLEDPALASLRAYVESLEDALLQVAVELASKWGAR